ncbi:MAG: redoxin family protein [Planctomycetota bacterium]
MMRRRRLPLSALLFAFTLVPLVGCQERYVKTFYSGTDVVRKEGLLVRHRNGSLFTYLQQGPWTFNYESGDLKAQGNYKDDVQDGEWVYYYESGEQKMIGSFEKRRRDGKWNYYYDNGRPRAEGSFERGRRVGEWVYWNPDGTKVASEADKAPPAPVASQPMFSEADVKKFWHYLKRFGNRPPPADLQIAGKQYPSLKEKNPQGNKSKSGSIVGNPLPTKEFMTGTGKKVDIGMFRGKKVVLVLLRGYSGGICVYCTAQTAALHKSYRKIKAKGAEVAVVFPGTSNGLGAFEELYTDTFGEGKPPYPMLYDDPKLGLTGTLGLEGRRAIPTTMLLDKEGVVRWAYVGKDDQDRPPVERILKELETF